MNNIGIIITIVVIAVVFGYLWYSGQLARLKSYWDETMVEMQKCTWPTWNELKGSTMVVLISIMILGGFTVAVDLIMNWCVLHFT